jgi:hypothetical protein
VEARFLSSFQAVDETSCISAEEEALQEENREVGVPASPRMSLPPVVNSSLQDEDEALSSSGSPLAPFEQLLTPTLVPRQSLKVYWRHQPRMAGGGKMQQEAGSVHQWTLQSTSRSCPLQLALKAQQCLYR